MEISLKIATGIIISHQWSITASRPEVRENLPIILSDTFWGNMLYNPSETNNNFKSSWFISTRGNNGRIIVNSRDEQILMLSSFQTNLIT